MNDQGNRSFNLGEMKLGVITFLIPVLGLAYYRVRLADRKL
jgi:hypothetical protein